MLESIAPLFSIKQLMLDGIDILNLPTDIGNALGIGAFAGGILATLILLFAFCSLAIYKKNTTAIVIISVLVLFFAVSVTWISIFSIVIIIGLVAFGIVRTVNDFLREHGGGK